MRENGILYHIINEWIRSIINFHAGILIEKVKFMRRNKSHGRFLQSDAEKNVSILKKYSRSVERNIAGVNHLKINFSHFSDDLIIGNSGYEHL